MAEVANYVYIFGPLCWAALVGFGGLVVTLSTQHLRLARGFFVLSAIPLSAVPITFGWSAHSSTIGLTVAGLSAFALGTIYYAGIWILNEYVNRTDEGSQPSDS